MRRADFVSKDQKPGVSRRSLLIGGGAAAGLLVAWGVWPRDYRPNLAVAGNETLFNAFLKIDTSGQIIVVVPQLEMGQGVTTALPQILADELGADWRTIAVQSAPVSPLYANALLAGEWLDPQWAQWTGEAGRWAMHEYATRSAMMLTAGSTSVRMFARAYREAGAAARVLLCKAAAARWDVAWESCDIREGLVTDGQRSLRIGELAHEAAAFALPEIVPQRQDGEKRLLGQSVPRLDIPSKIDGSHNFAADIRLPDMLFASIRQGPIGALGLGSVNEAAARKVSGFVQIVKRERWVAALANNWWAANKALDALDPSFSVAKPLVSSATIDRALEAAFGSEAGRRLFEQGDLATVFDGASAVKRDYVVAPALHLAIEPPCATARVSDGKAEVWTATQAPAFCRRAIADALEMNEEAVTLYPLAAGGSFGRRMEHDAAVQAAILAKEAGRPVQLLWSRLEEMVQDRPRAPAKARMAAKLSRTGMIEGWSAKVAAPVALSQTWARVAYGADPAEASREAASRAHRHGVSGMPGPYALGAFAVDHYPADIGLPTGRWRANADGVSAFFTESFVDELAHQAGIEPMSFRIQHLGQQPRLAHCLTTVAAMGGWEGGVPGSAQGIACHMMDGSMCAVLVEAGLEEGRIRVQRICAAVDVGEQPHPDIARQQIEGGLIFGLASALGGAGDYRKGMPRRTLMGRMGLPRLADVGEVEIEMIPSSGVPGGVGQIAVPPVAPALANALFAATGRRFRSLPLISSA